MVKKGNLKAPRVDLELQTLEILNKERFISCHSYGTIRNFDVDDVAEI
jgi:hypothetical protein